MAARKSKKKAGKAKTRRGKTAKKTASQKVGVRTPPPKGPARTSGESRVAEIQRLIDVMVSAGAVEVEMEEKGRRVRVRLKEDPPVAMVPYAAGSIPQAGIVPMAEPAAGDSTAGGDSDTFVFHSPMVGTFYQAPSPEAEPFVREGQEVTPDTTLCILEAMKVMNEIKAETDGVIVEILAENGESIEFGQPLFVLEVS